MDIPRINDKTNQMFFYIWLINRKPICQTKKPIIGKLQAIYEGA